MLIASTLPDPVNGEGVADKLGFDVTRVEKYAKMNLKELFDATSEEGYKKEPDAELVS